MEVFVSRGGGIPLSTQPAAMQRPLPGPLISDYLWEYNKHRVLRETVGVPGEATCLNQTPRTTRMHIIPKPIHN